MGQNSPHDEDSSGRDLIKRARAGEHDAINAIARQALERLRREIAGRLPSHVRRHTDEEDLANSVMKSFFHGVAAERFPRLEDVRDLWQILGMLTRQKLAKHIRRASAQKRGSGTVRGDSFFTNENGHDGKQGLDSLHGNDRDAYEQLTQLETMDGYLRMLPDDVLRAIALLKLDGYDNNEIARFQDISVRTVERKLQWIRECWSTSDEQDVG